MRKKTYIPKEKPIRIDKPERFYELINQASVNKRLSIRQMSLSTGHCETYIYTCYHNGVIGISSARKLEYMYGVTISEYSTQRSKLYGDVVKENVNVLDSRNNLDSLEFTIHIDTNILKMCIKEAVLEAYKEL